MGQALSWSLCEAFHCSFLSPCILPWEAARALGSPSLLPGMLVLTKEHSAQQHSPVLFIQHLHSHLQLQQKGSSFMGISVVNCMKSLSGLLRMWLWEGGGLGRRDGQSSVLALFPCVPSMKEGSSFAQGPQRSCKCSIHFLLLRCRDGSVT